jgi:DNA-directed RNA polymerase specialized sigma24 family protein
MLTAPDDRARLILQAFFVERSEEAFCALFKLLFPKLKRYLSICGAPADVAEQLAIDSLCTVYLRTGDVRDLATFGGWIYRIAKNELLQFQRTVSWVDTAAAIELRDWLACLDPQGRDIMYLRFVEGLECHEIAEAMSIPLGTVKWKISDCKLKLARSLGAREKV